MKRAFLGLGSNLGDRRQNLDTALERLAGKSLQVVRVSSIYETEPRGIQGQPWFLNLVAEVETELLPVLLLKHLQRVEKSMGRQRTISKGPRVIDIDILLYAQFVIDTPHLTVPHALMEERRFVLEPMTELAPELRHPVYKRTMREMLAAVKDQALKRYTG
ncbi:MAG: 2-amino-4-hydroxy-6-hydroxymethyldihydropteridine diphosphokinase [Acidimicrobiia bacterium]|nr:2-amino-4-hydroxy-6-hydroxymethyldihydropteridine diphosphokinase [Acidimicrobiia bacterium]